MYFMVKSCIHTVRWLEFHQNMPYLSLYRHPVPNSAKFRENIDIPRKWANSVAQLKIPRFVEKCGPYLLLLTVRPSFVGILPSHVTRDVDSTVLLQCSAFGIPTPNITWFRNSRLIEPSTSTRFVYPVTA